MTILGVTEVVSTIMGKEVPQYNAAELLDSSLEELMNKHQMTEKEGLRILAVKQLSELLEAEQRKKQFGFEVHRKESLGEVAMYLAKEEQLLIMPFNTKLRLGTHQYFSLSDPQLYKKVVQFLCCEPASNFAAVVKENSVSNSSREHARRFYDLGKVIEVELVDFISCTDSEYHCLKN